MDKLKARVAKVSDDNFTVVLNIGENAGVEEGDRYLVYSFSNEPIIDPDTNESLGKLEIVKGNGEVIHVQEKMCTLRSIAVRTVKRAVPSDEFSLSSRTVVYNDSEEVPFDNPAVGDHAKKI